MHGGNIYRLIEERNLGIDKILDFSASINPLGVPESAIKAINNNLRYLCHYPDPDAKGLRMEISRHIGIEPEFILCGNGSTELIYLTVRSLRPERVLIPVPTFSEYERASKNWGAEVFYYELKKEEHFDIDHDRFISEIERFSFESETRAIRLIFLCNPNNPTGRIFKKEDMLKIVEATKKLGCYLLVDEAFIDFVPEESVAKEVQHNPYLIVLRSMTKFYALSGIRIGYGIFHPSILAAIKRHKEPWTVNTLAQVAGSAVLNDKVYKDQTFKVISEGKKILEDGLNALGIHYIKSAVNFYLLRYSSAQSIIASLKDSGIIVRDCSNFRGLNGSYMRIAVRTNRENLKFLEELKQLGLED